MAMLGTRNARRVSFRTLTRNSVTVLVAMAFFVTLLWSLCALPGRGIRTVVAENHAAAVSGLQIVPGATWTAAGTDKHLQAHGAGILKVGNTFYMVGEDKSAGANFVHVNCYSSRNLVEWKFENYILSRDDRIPELGPLRIIERPKILFNRQTNLYVLLMHVDSADYKAASVGVATSRTVCGNYTWVKSYRPSGQQSRDMGVFQDEDGTAYLLSEDRPNGLHIYKLSPDYLSVTEVTHTWPQKIESPAMLRRGNLYYMFGSHLTGWAPNDNVYSTSTSLRGPWTNWTEFAPKGSKTYNSQTTLILPISRDLVLYQGDRWLEKRLQWSSYIWLPLTIDGRKVTLQNRASWAIDLERGAWGPTADRWVDARTGTLLGGAKLLEPKNGSATRLVGNIGGPARGALVLPDVALKPGKRTFQIQYSNGDAKERSAWFSVGLGGGAGAGVGTVAQTDFESSAETTLEETSADSIPTTATAPPLRRSNSAPLAAKRVKISFVPTRSGSRGISVAHVDVPAGARGIRFEGVDNGWGPDVERFSIPS